MMILETNILRRNDYSVARRDCCHSMADLLTLALDLDGDASLYEFDTDGSGPIVVRDLSEQDPDRSFPREFGLVALIDAYNLLRFDYRPRHSR